MILRGRPETAEVTAFSPLFSSTQCNAAEQDCFTALTVIHYFLSMAVYLQEGILRQGTPILASNCA
jgi:hypothetical protein